MAHPKQLAMLALVLTAVFVWSAIDPNDRFTWYLEAVPELLQLATERLMERHKEVGS